MYTTHMEYINLKLYIILQIKTTQKISISFSL